MNELGPRRNPKRKANEDSSQHMYEEYLPEKLVEEALRPLTANEIEEWEGWAEIESEPAIFNFILQKLGVQGVTTKELLSYEHWALNSLPHPVFGLIFLFQYAPDLEDGDDDNDDDDGEEAPLWFANQATNNSCASVALLNIVMNADEVELGDQLQAFKDSTRELPAPFRGHRVGSNSFIRTAHNSFVKRMDQLSADLFLADEAEAARVKPAKKRPTTAKKRKKRQSQATSKGKPEADYGFHFIAYVPANGHVWELDGMRTKPRRVGPIDSVDWTTTAGIRIQERIQQYDGTQNEFSLLALCRSPLVVLRARIATALAELGHFQDQIHGNAMFAELVPLLEGVLDLQNPVELGEFGLQESDIVEAEVPVSRKMEIWQPGRTMEEAYAMHEELTSVAKSALAKYRQETFALVDDKERVHGRRRDYTPVLYHWMKKLAEKGVLEDVIKASQ
ncbi:hypothetical protein RJ55_01900 [Drechmeria coniospora]|nr:hypothetical protein RJ55_01900 [Drechmeria coniospora]